MNRLEMLTKVDKIYTRLQDEESQEVFEARINYMIDRDWLKLWHQIKKNKEWYFNNYRLEDENYIIFGAGLMGKLMKEILEEGHKKVMFFVDNDEKKHGISIDGKNVFGVSELLNYPQTKLVVSNRIYTREAIKQLKDIGATNEVIDESEVCAFTGKQYFDVFTSSSDECFIDAGCFDGGTIVDFIEWMDGKDYSHIYSFEPDTHSIINCQKKIEDNGIERVTLIPKGTYSKESILRFSDDGTGGSCFCEQGNIEVPVTSIDQVLQGGRATYIKMDVEGREKETILGCRNTIERYHPKMAVCVYHKPFDFIELPLLLLEMNPDYKFYIRHYASNLCETVLYAI